MPNERVTKSAQRIQQMMNAEGQQPYKNTPTDREIADAFFFAFIRLTVDLLQIGQIVDVDTKLLEYSQVTKTAIEFLEMIGVDDDFLATLPDLE